MRTLLRSNEEIRYGQSTTLGTIVPLSDTSRCSVLDQPYAEQLYNEMDRPRFTPHASAPYSTNAGRRSYNSTHADKVDHCVPTKVPSASKPLETTHQANRRLQDEVCRRIPIRRGAGPYFFGSLRRQLTRVPGVLQAPFRRRSGL
jgi:hypothetical protein